MPYNQRQIEYLKGLNESDLNEYVNSLSPDEQSDLDASLSSYAANPPSKEISQYIAGAPGQGQTQTVPIQPLSIQPKQNQQAVQQSQIQQPQAQPLAEWQNNLQDFRLSNGAVTKKRSDNALWLDASKGDPSKPAGWYWWTNTGWQPAPSEPSAVSGAYNTVRNAMNAPGAFVAGAVKGAAQDIIHGSAETFGNVAKLMGQTPGAPTSMTTPYLTPVGITTEYKKAYLQQANELGNDIIAGNEAAKEAENRVLPSAGASGKAGEYVGKLGSTAIKGAVGGLPLFGAETFLNRYGSVAGEGDNPSKVLKGMTSGAADDAVLWLTSKVPGLTPQMAFGIKDAVAKAIIQKLAVEPITESAVQTAGGLAVDKLILNKKVSVSDAIDNYLHNLAAFAGFKAMGLHETIKAEKANASWLNENFGNNFSSYEDAKNNISAFISEVAKDAISDPTPQKMAAINAARQSLAILEQAERTGRRIAWQEEPAKPTEAIAPQEKASTTPETVSEKPVLPEGEPNAVQEQGAREMGAQPRGTEGVGEQAGGVRQGQQGAEATGTEGAKPEVLAEEAKAGQALDIAKESSKPFRGDTDFYTWLDRANYTNGLPEVANSLGVSIKPGESKTEIIAKIKGLLPEKPSSSKESRYPETRGGMYRFHGARAPIEKLSDDYAMSGDSRNVYGQGFYTTDALDVSAGYMGHGKKGGELYRVENRDVPLFDLEGKLTNGDVAMVKKALAGTMDLPEETTNGDKIKNMRQLFDAIRDNSEANGLSRDSVQDIFDSIRYALEKKGFRGYSHIGGLQTKSKQHNVKIFWYPESDVKITKSKLTDYQNHPVETAKSLAEPGVVADTRKEGITGEGHAEDGTTGRVGQEGVEYPSPKELREDRPYQSEESPAQREARQSRLDATDAADQSLLGWSDRSQVNDDAFKKASVRTPRLDYPAKFYFDNEGHVVLTVERNGRQSYVTGHIEPNGDIAIGELDGNKNRGIGTDLIQSLVRSAQEIYPETRGKETRGYAGGSTEEGPEGIHRMFDRFKSTVWSEEHKVSTLSDDIADSGFKHVPSLEREAIKAQVNDFYSGDINKYNRAEAYKNPDIWTTKTPEELNDILLSHHEAKMDIRDPEFLAETFGGQAVYERITKKMGLPEDASLREIGEFAMGKIKSLGKTVAETTNKILTRVAGIGRQAAERLAQFLHDEVDRFRKRNGEQGAVSFSDLEGAKKNPLFAKMLGEQGAKEIASTTERLGVKSEVPGEAGPAPEAQSPEAIEKRAQGYATALDWGNPEKGAADIGDAKELGKGIAELATATPKKAAKVAYALGDFINESARRSMLAATESGRKLSPKAETELVKVARQMSNAGLLQERVSPDATELPKSAKQIIDYARPTVVKDIKGGWRGNIQSLSWLDQHVFGKGKGGLSNDLYVQANRGAINSANFSEVKENILKQHKIRNNGAEIERLMNKPDASLGNATIGEVLQKHLKTVHPYEASLAELQDKLATVTKRTQKKVDAYVKEIKGEIRKAKGDKAKITELQEIAKENIAELKAGNRRELDNLTLAIDRFVEEKEPMYLRSKAAVDAAFRLGRKRVNEAISLYPESRVFMLAETNPDDIKKAHESLELLCQKNNLTPDESRELDNAKTLVKLDKLAKPNEREAAAKFREMMDTVGDMLEESGVSAKEDYYMPHAMLKGMEFDRMAPDSLRESLDYAKRTANVTLMPSVNVALDGYLNGAARRISMQPILDKWLPAINPEQPGSFLDPLSDKQAPNYAAKVKDILTELQTPQPDDIFMKAIRFQRNFQIMKAIGLSLRTAIKHATKMVEIANEHGVHMAPGMKDVLIGATGDVLDAYANSRGVSGDVVRKALIPVRKALGVDELSAHQVAQFARNYLATTELRKMMNEDPAAMEFAYSLNPHLAPDSRGVAAAIGKGAGKLKNAMGQPVSAVEAWENFMNMASSIEKGGVHGLGQEKNINAMIGNILAYDYKPHTDTPGMYRSKAAKMLTAFVTTPHKNVELFSHILARGLRREKDVYGTSETSKMIRDMVAIGAVTAGASQIGWHFLHDKFHAPLVNQEWWEHLGKFAYNKVAGSNVKAKKEWQALQGVEGGPLTLFTPYESLMDLYRIGNTGDFMAPLKQSTAWKEYLAFVHGKVPKSYNDIKDYVLGNKKPSAERRMERYQIKKGQKQQKSHIRANQYNTVKDEE